MSATEYDADRYCNRCEAQARVHLVIERRLVEITCRVCGSQYELERYSL